MFSHTAQYYDTIYLAVKDYGLATLTPSITSPEPSSVWHST